MMDRLTFMFGTDAAGLSPKDAAKRSTRCFVRSEGALAVYEKSRNPSGHVLTAWEAFTTFGIDVLEEAVEYGSAILKRSRDSTKIALKSRRANLGLTQESLRRAARVTESDVMTAETTPDKVPIQKLERIAFALGLDERFLAFKRDAGGDDKLAYRLRTLQVQGMRPSDSGTISAGTALLFAEAASIIRVQHRLQEWLGLQMDSDRFSPHPDYGSPMNPAWSVGYDLAERARETLRIGDSPIDSMRNLVEERMGIPVVQARLDDKIAGATVMTTTESGGEARGVVLNTVGENQNVWIRRATLAHELGHLLYDPDERLENVRVDSYVDSQQDAQAHLPDPDYVEQRANAFAIAFLAPNAAVREFAPTPISSASVSKVMRTFGISHTAANYHIANCHYRNFDMPEGAIDSVPSDEQTAAENFSIDYFPIYDTPEQRRGRFAGLVVASYDHGFISADTAAMYLSCKVEDFIENVDVETVAMIRRHLAAEPSITGKRYAGL